MHPSVMDFLRKSIGVEDVAGRDVLEVGSQNVNGSPREVIAPLGPKKYIGVDFVRGDGVDLVMDVKDLVSYFDLDWFDLVVSTEMLEHVQDWRVAVDQMKRVLLPGGLLVVTTRSPGFPYHGYPHDYWRYTVSDFMRIFGDMEIEHIEPDPLPGHPGVLMKARKIEGRPFVDLSKITVSVVH